MMVFFFSLSGSLLNFFCFCDSGTATFTIVGSQIPVSGPNSIVGRAVVVRADPDDLGKGIILFRNH